MSPQPASLPDDPDALKALVAQLQAQNSALTATVRVFEQHIANLQLRIAKLKRQAFGKASEKVEREIEQLELALEDLLIARAEASSTPPVAAEEASDLANADAVKQRAPRRRPRVSAETPRERRKFDPGTACLDCGGALRLVGEDVSEMLDLIVAQLKVIEIARLKKSCRACEKMVQVPAPCRPIPGSLATASLLAYILVSKFDDHLPLYRLNEIFARMGVDIPDTTLVDWCGRTMKLLLPLIERIESHVLAGDVLHADDTPIRVLDPSLRKASGKGGSGPTFSISDLGLVGRHRVRLTNSLPTGKRSMSLDTCAMPAASFRLKVIKAMASSMPRAPMALRNSGRRPAGRICAEISMTYGSAPNRRLPAKRWTALAPSTISRLRSPAKVLKRAMRRDNCTANPRLRHSMPGFKSSSPKSLPRAIWPMLCDTR
jgi:transposase